MWPKDFLDIIDVSTEDILTLFDLVAEMKERPAEFRNSCDSKVLGMLFRKPSTRTRVSFEVGIYQLGGTGLLLRPDELQLGRGESIADTAKVLSRYMEAIMIRTFEHREIVEFAEHATMPVINGLTDYLHPCQGLTDYFTIWEHTGTLRGLKIAYLGDGNNVAHSLITGAAKLGVDLTIGCPRGFEPDQGVVDRARSEAKVTGARLNIINDPEDAVEDARVIYTDVWTSMGQEREAAKRKKLFEPFRVNLELLSFAHPDWLFMHCLPAHRGDEVVDEVADHPQSVIFDQAENRLHVQKGILYNLLQK